MKKGILTIGLLLVTTQAFAAAPFSLDLDVAGSSGRMDFTKIEDFVDALNNQTFKALTPAYTDTSAATASLNIRGIPAVATYTAGSTTLNFRVDKLGINESFTGATRNASQEMFEDFLEKNGNGVLEKLLNYAAQSTPIDPVAGNPNSLMALMGAADFSSGTDVSGGAPKNLTAAQSKGNRIGVGAEFGRFSSGGYDQDAYTLPLSYTVMMSEPGYLLKFDLPLTYVDTEGAKSYNGSLGVSLRWPVLKSWTLTPAVRAGAVGSIDLGSAAFIYSGSLTSNYNLYFGDIRVSIGNMLSYLKTKSVDAGDYEIKYDLSNTMMKNGIGAEGPTSFNLFGGPVSWQADIAHTNFFGDELFIDSYTDFGVSLGTFASRLGLTYTTGANDFSGFRVNFGYRF